MGLKTDKDTLCTWLSRDGGLTWTDIIDDVYIYEFLNHGNIIAMAKFRCDLPAGQSMRSMHAV
jgi:sortilin